MHSVLTQKQLKRFYSDLFKKRLALGQNPNMKGFSLKKRSFSKVLSEYQVCNFKLLFFARRVLNFSIMLDSAALLVWYLQPKIRYKRHLEEIRNEIFFGY